jgi:hypothetical protein
MGIHQTKSLLKTYYSKAHPKDTDGYLNKVFCPESLQLNEFLDDFWDTNANEYFDWTNIQENKKPEDVQKEKEKLNTREKYILPELPLNPTITDNLFNIDTLAEFKEAYNPPDSKYFSNNFIKRMNIILIAYVKKILSTYNENSTLDCIGKFFESADANDDKLNTANLELGMNLFTRLLDDISSKTPKLKEDTLNFLSTNSVFLRPFVFFGGTKKHFILDKSLDEITTYLKKIISDKDETPVNKYKAFKVLLNFGFAKASLRNLLDFVDYFKYIEDFVDLNYEINLFKNEFIKLSLSVPSDENVKVNSKLWGFKFQQKKKEGEEIKTDSNTFSVTNDSSYIYVYSSQGYLAKIGTGYNNTMLGKIYLFKENYRVGERATIVLVEGVLYYRSPNLDPNPVICISPETFEEIPINYDLNNKEVNYLWVEGKKQEFEFPHTSYKDMNEIIEKKKNLGAEDKSNNRPCTASPMVSDGRYIYIFSKWYDDIEVNLDKAADDDDDEPKQPQKKQFVSIYGVDIYDPLSNMVHIKSVKFNIKKEHNEEEIPDLLRTNVIIFTNGNIFVVDKYKVNLSTGEAEKITDNYVSEMKTACYDLQNNNIWGIKYKVDGSTEKLDLVCFFNHSAKPIVEYPETNEKYMPCSLEKIIQHAEELIKLENLTTKVSMKTYLRESTLNILGLEDKNSIEYKKQNLTIQQDDKSTLPIYKKSAQCLILSTIAKLSEYYGQVQDVRSANTDEERGRIISQACRRPYCVKLEPETFEILINFINEFSASFFKNNGCDPKMRKLDNYCLLSTIKILRTNLNCLSISNLDIDFFIKDKNNNPFIKVKEFIFRIFEAYHGKQKDEDIEIIRALYEECKIILSVSINILYPNINEIIEILEHEITKFKESKYSKDVVKCILEWMSNEDNMKNLLLKLKKDGIERIFNIFKIVSTWEVQHFKTYISEIKSVQTIPKYSANSHDEVTAFKFSSNMQIEILKSISKKLLNDNYEEIENEQTLFSFSKIIFENIHEIFRILRVFLEQLPNIIEKDWKSINKTDEPVEETIDTTVPVSNPEKIDSSKHKTLEEYKNDRYKEIWNQVVDKIISNDLLIIKTFNFHIDSLSILTSNFILSSMMLNSYHSIIDEMNKIYYLLKECEKKEEKAELSDYKELIFESEHPYPANLTKWYTLEIPGEKEIFIEFDPQCYTKQNCAYVNLYTDMNMSTYAFPQYTTLNTNYPKEQLKWSNGPLYLYFYSDSCTNSQTYWGFKVKIHNGKNNSYVKLDDKFTAMMRSVCWVSCKCSAQLLRGNFTKSLTSVSEEDDLKYNSILNSKLFAGGVDFEDITRENDPLLTNIINIFDTIIPDEHKSIKVPKSHEKIILTNILNGDNKNILKVLSVLQKKFSKEVVWSTIGGEQADSLVRAAFAALLRHSDHTADFERLLDYLDFSENAEESNGYEETVTKNIQESQCFPIIYKKWVAASRMRTWLVEKKKNIDELLEKTKGKKEENAEESSENSSNDITRKIIEQTIIKAKFLIKLNPSPAFSHQDQDKNEKKNLFVRSSSLDLENSQDDWKRRLHNWKAVQKSKKVIKSVEEEANENLTSLTSAVLMCLQSSISCKRLWNKIKIATIRAKGREIGLLTISNILENITHPNLIQDLLSWFCASLRKVDNKICHYLDNVSGCGRHFEERVKHSFQDFISLLITKLIKSEKPNELKSFIDALVWKYSANDHKFLVDHSIFLILWGTYNEAIKTSWGKPIKNNLEAPEDKKLKLEESSQFTNELLEVFEVLSNICLDRAIIARNADKLKHSNAFDTKKAAVNIKFPTLERQTSILDDTNSESLVRHILDVIFGEVTKAIASYLRYRGISSNLWKQYEQYQIVKASDKPAKPNENNNAAENNENREEESSDGEANNEEEEVAEPEEAVAVEEEAKEEAKEEVKEDNKDEKKKDDNAESADKPYFYEPADLLSLYDELRGLSGNNNNIKRAFINDKDLMNIIIKQNSEIYDSEFLNRLLTILYKCSIQSHNDKIAFPMANPLNFSSLIKLIRLCSTQNKILIVKILQNICSHVPEEILIESIDMIVSQPEGDKLLEEFAERRKDFKEYDKMIFVEFIITLIKDIRNRAWNKDAESYGCFIVSNELVLLLRKLWETDTWNECITALLSEVIDEKNLDLLKKEIILSIFGSDYRGQANGATIKVKTDLDIKGLNFDFIKKDYDEHYSYGTVIGFSNNMDELWNKKQSKENKKKKKNTSISLTPNNNPENQIAVLLHGSILKEDFNIIDLTPKIYGQHEVMITQKKVDLSHFKVTNQNLLPLLDYLLNNTEKSSEAVNYKTEIIRFINNYLSDEKGVGEFLALDQKVLTDTINSLATLANKQIQYKTNYLNLDILEEKRYRLLSFCAENGYSLKEIPRMSITFKKPNYLILRCSSENLINLVFNLTGVVNYEHLCRLTDYQEIGVDDDSSSSSNKEYIVCPPESVDKYIGKQVTIITHGIDTKTYEQKIKKTDQMSIAVLDYNNYAEILSIYNSTINENSLLEESDSFKSIIKPKDAKSSIIDELEEFGFSRELIEAEINKSKEDLDMNSLIANLLEYKEKNKDLEEKTEEEKKQELEKEKAAEAQQEEIDNENKNDCFTTNDNEGKATVPDYMDDLFLGENEDFSLLYKNFKSINEKLHILYARRILLSIFSKLIEDSSQSNKNEAILTRIPIEQIINVLKLLTHEGLFLNSISWGSELLLQIKKVLIKIYSSNNIQKCQELSDILTKATLSELESVIKSKNTAYDFITKNEESLINKPMIFFNIWILMIMNDNSKTKTEYSFVFNILAGLVTKITDNKQIRWFIIDLLIQLVYKINNKLKEDPEFIKVISQEKSLKDVENINKLRLYLDDSINRESKKNLSKRSQMMCEFLIYLEETCNRINLLAGKGESDNLSIILQTDYKKDNFIAELLTTFEMMKEFFEKKYLKYLSWIETNPDIVNTSKITFESSHLYPKAPHTFLVNVPNTTALEVNISSDTLLDNGDAVVFSLDKNSSYPIECYANRSSKKNFTIQSSHMFVHCPSNYLTEVYSFGSNTYTRLGQNGTDIFTPKIIESLSSVLVKDIAIGDTFVMVLTNSGELLACGNGIAAGLKQTSNTFVKATGISNPEKINSEGINLFAVNNGSTIVATKDYSFYSLGVNAFGQLGQAWTSPVNEITTMTFQKKIKQISIGETHSMLTTFDGKVYHLGNNDYYQNGENNTSRNNTPKLVIIPKNLFVEQCTVGEHFSIFLTKDVITGKRKLYAAGWSKQGRTGTGKEDESNAFKAITAPEIENVEFRFITSGKLSSAAISTNNKLYTWGNNPKGQLGLGHYNDVCEPTLVTFFDKYDIEDVSMSLEHTLVIAKDVEKNKISVFAFGDSTNGKLGETVGQKAEKKDTAPTPVKVSFFEGRNPTRVITGPRASVVICKLNSYESLRDYHNITCSGSCNAFIKGNLFADLSKELKVYCNECHVEQAKQQLVFKAPLKDYKIISEIFKKNEKVLDADNVDTVSTIQCKHCKEFVTLAGGNYAYLFLENKAKSALCKNCFDIFPSSITSAKVYLKTSLLLKNIDITQTTEFYENSMSYGHKFTVTPVLNEKGCESIIEKYQNSFNSYVEDINEFGKSEVYEHFVDLLNSMAQKAEKSIFTYQPKDLSFKKEELSVRPALEKCSNELLRKLFIMLKILNNKVKELLPFIDFSKVLQDNQRLSHYFNKITPLIFWDTKNELIKYYLEKTACEFEVGELKVNRLKIRKFIEKGKPDHTGEYTLFGHIFQFLRSKPFKIFRKKDANRESKLFNVGFVGEASIDAGGPYREALTQAFTELQSPALPLFIPSPNQKNESGLFREKWVVNPSSKSTIHLEMYKVLGGLIGYAIRTGEFLSFDLPSIFWKQLLEVPIDRKDLECIDRYTVQCLDDIINIHKKGVTADTFTFYVDQKFTTCLSDGSEVEVIKNGKDIELTYADRIKYCELVEKIRLEESKIQMDAVRSGLE